MRSSKALLGSFASLAVFALALVGNGCSGDDNGGGGSGGTSTDAGAGKDSSPGQGGSNSVKSDAANDVAVDVAVDAVTGAGGSNQTDAQGVGGSVTTEGGVGGAVDSGPVGTGGAHDSGPVGTGGAGTGGAGPGAGGAQDSGPGAGGAQDSGPGAGGAQDSGPGAGGAHDSGPGAGGQAGTGGTHDAGLDVGNHDAEAAAPQILCTFNHPDAGVSDAGTGTNGSICEWIANGPQGSYGTTLITGSENYPESDAGIAEGAIEFIAHFNEADVDGAVGVVRVRQDNNSTASGANEIQWDTHTTLHAMVKVEIPGSLSTVGLSIGHAQAGALSYWNGPAVQVPTGTWTQLDFDYETLASTKPAGFTFPDTRNRVAVTFNPGAKDAGNWTDATVLVDYVWLE